MATLVILSLFVAATNGLIIRDNYDVVTKDSFCENREAIYMDRGLIFRLEEDYLNSLLTKQGLECSMSVGNLNKIGGIILIIQQLKLRKDESNKEWCLDYIEVGNALKYNCKEIVMGRIFLDNGTSWDPPKFISKFSKESLTYPKGTFINYSISIKLYVKRWPLLPGQRLSFLMSAIGFLECDALNVPKGMFNCGYGVCILEMFVGDGIVNCPFGDCRDEGNCSNALKDLNVLINGTFSEDPMISNSTVALPTTSEPLILGLRRKEGWNRTLEEEDIHLQQDEWKENVTQELRDIKQEIKKSTGYLERILQAMGINISS